MLHIEFTTDLGAKVTVDVATPDELLDVQRRYGRLGWYSGDVPAGGFQFPLDNEADFDWALLGGRKFTTEDGEEAVYCRGSVWKRRELAAVDTRKMRLPQAVKYSRGARPTDPEHLKESADGDIQYVTLAIFRGGRRQPQYAMPEGTQRAGRTDGTRAPADLLNKLVARAREGGHDLGDLVRGVGAARPSELSARQVEELLARL